MQVQTPYPTTVNGLPFKVKWVPEVLTKPVGVAVGVEAGVETVTVELGGGEAAPGRHCE